MAAAEKGRNKNVASVFELPEKSARIVLKYWKLFLFVNLPFILLSVPAVFGSDFANPNPTEESLANITSGEILAIIGFVLIFSLIALFFYGMTIKLSLDATVNKKVEARTLINVGAKFWLRLLGLSALSGLLIVIGLILLIVPGIIAAILFAFAPAILIDKNSSILDAIRGSYRMVTANAGPVLSAIFMFIILTVAASVIMEISYVGPVIGTALSILFSLILFFRYQELKEDAGVPAVKQ